MSDNVLEMKTIAELQNYHFVIPAYQRGYRWKPLNESIMKYSEFA